MSFEQAFRLVIFPASILSGTIIGAGMFALPFIFQTAGWLLGFFYLAALTSVLALVHLMYADIIVRTDCEPKFAGYVKEYVGRWAFFPAVAVTVAGMLLVLTIYLVLSVSFVKLMAVKVDESTAALVLWLFGSLAVFLETKKLAFSEFFITLAMTFIILVVAITGFKNILSGGGFSFNFINFSEIFLPFGPILFALAGRTAIPSVVDYFQKTKISPDLLKSSIVTGTALPAAAYLLFVVGIVGLSAVVSEDAVSGLIMVNDRLRGWLGLLGFMAIFSTYFIIGVSVKNILKYDLRLPGFAANLAVIFTPLVLYLAGFKNFLLMVSLAGGVFIAMEAVFIVLAWNGLNSSGKPRMLIKSLGAKTAYFLALIFLTGIIYEIIYAVI